MFRKMLLTFAIGSAFLFSGCASTGMYSHTGFAAISLQKEGVQAMEKSGGSRRGEACTTNVLGIVAMGDGTIEAAKRAGGVTSVSSVDVEYTNILGIYGSACTVVRGN